MCKDAEIWSEKEKSGKENKEMKLVLRKNTTDALASANDRGMEVYDVCKTVSENVKREEKNKRDKEDIVIEIGEVEEKNKKSNKKTTLTISVINTSVLQLGLQKVMLGYSRNSQKNLSY